MKSTNVSVKEPQAPGHRTEEMRRRIWNYAGAVLACLFTAGFARLLQPWVDPTNIVMLFLLAVFPVSYTHLTLPTICSV